MLCWSALFLLISVVAAALGLVDSEPGAAGAARVLFAVFATMFVVTLFGGAIRRE